MRTPCTTAATPRPSYRWVRPRNTSTRLPSASTDRTRPAWPSTAGGAKPGSSVTGRSWLASPSTSAAGTQPEPSTTATSCRCHPGAPRPATGRRGGRRGAGRPEQRARGADGHEPEATVTPGRDGRGDGAGPPRSRRGRRPPRRTRPSGPGSARTGARPRRRPARTARPVLSPSRVCTRTRTFRYSPASAPSHMSSSRSSAAVTSYSITKTCEPASSTTVISAPPASASSPPKVSRHPTSQPVPAGGECGACVGHVPRVEIAAVRRVQGHARQGS